MFPLPVWKACWLPLTAFCPVTQTARPPLPSFLTSWRPAPVPQAAASHQSTTKFPRSSSVPTSTRSGSHLPSQEGQSPNGLTQGPDLLARSCDEGCACVQDGTTALGTETQPCANLHTVRGGQGRSCHQRQGPGVPQTLTSNPNEASQAPHLSMWTCQ